MGHLHEEEVTCPYCGESIVVLIDPTDIDQEYIEDCQVCCRPINFSVRSDSSGELAVSVYTED